MADVSGLRSSRGSRRLMAVAMLMIVVPLFLGAVVFLYRAPGREPGVYVEVELRAAGRAIVFPVLGFSIDDPNVARQATVLPTGRIRSFFVVGLGAPDVHANPALQFFAADRSDEIVRPVPLSVVPTIRSINGEVYRVTADAFDPDGPAFPYFREVLANARGSRATIELLVGLAVTDPTGRRQMYAVRWTGQ